MKFFNIFKFFGNTFINKLLHVQISIMKKNKLERKWKGKVL